MLLDINSGLFPICLTQSIKKELKVFCQAPDTNI